MNLTLKGSIRLLFFTCAFFSRSVLAQVQPYSPIDNLQPLTPTAFQFLKYTQLPVSEYTGLPSISVPLYEIKEDGVSIPLTLTYQANGFRVNQEASWVGLGWDMTVGSIVQQVFDQDDLSAQSFIQPDYMHPGTPNQYPFAYQYCNANGGDLLCNYGCSGSVHVDTATYLEGLEIYTAQYAPFNGQYNTQNYGNFFSLHTQVNVDSEPDIFTANFLGHSFKFVWKRSAGAFVVLNKRGYKISYSATSGYFKVLVPTGEEYDFTIKSTVQTTSASQDVTGAGSQSPFALPTSNVFLLTKIITKNKKIITINYSTPSNSLVNCYPSFSQKGIVSTLTTNYTSNSGADWQNACQTGNLTTNAPTFPKPYTESYPQETYYYISSIIYPNGQVNFNTSTRNDIQGGMKLDGFTVTTTRQVKAVSFNYSYFDATSVGGNTYSFANASNFGNCPLYRLKLLSVVDNSGATHTFTYNTTQLPAKNSFATDYWGYYNGQTTNTTAIPNGSQFVNSSLGINDAAYGNNGDNHSANVAYATAAMLQQIQYPTGGSVNFNYELNQFNNYWVPDFANSNNTISSGNGLRVQAVVFNDASNNQLKKTTYTYSGGQAILPLNFFRNYVYTTIKSINPVAGTDQINFKFYSVFESNMSGSFSANPFASINGVGYSQVTKTDVDASGNPNGKTIINYYNTPDQVYNSGLGANQIDPTLPAYKNSALPDNGTLKSTLYYDTNNTLLKKIQNTYFNVVSPLFYGARLFGYASFVRYRIYQAPQWEQSALPQSMVGYYPIFDIETLPVTSTETDYFGADSLSVTTTSVYDTYTQLASVTKTNSVYNETSTYAYPYNVSGNTVLTAMVAQNRLADIVTYTKTTGSTHVPAYILNRTYQQLGTLFVPSGDVITTQSNDVYPTNVTYDQYDASNGNLFQYTKSTLTNSYIYDYNKENVIADATNALYSNIAYTSFEADGNGRWKFSGLASDDNTAVTGVKDYILSNGNIYRDSLDATKTYIVSYWSKSGPQTVNGSSTAVMGTNYNGWTYYEHTIPTPASNTITISGTGTIDELRLYPNNAQMTTYTYMPLVGVTSKSDESGKICYYEYDAAMRLLDIRDQYKNIIKAFCYNYAGQSTNCFVNPVAYSNVLQSQTFTKNNCNTGYTGSAVTYSVVAGQYTSNVSQADADNQATADMNANGQNYANANGTCLQNVSVNLSNSTGSTVYQVNFSSTNENITYNFPASGSSAITVPAGTYTVQVYPSSGTYTNHTITCGSQTVTNQPRTTFTNVSVTSGTTLTISIY